VLISNYLKCTRYMNLVVQLPDKRILLYRPIHNAQWSITIERFIKTTETPLDCVNDVLWNLFGINPNNYSDEFAEIKRFPTIKFNQGSNIIVYIAKLKSAISFRSKPREQFMAVSWKDILRDVMINSTYTEYNSTAKHTSNAVVVARELHIKEVF